MIDKKIKLFIKEHQLIEKGNTIIIGLSGGKDSVVMMHLLNELTEKYQLTLIACHLNHGIRGEEALRDQMFTKNLCEKLGVTFFTKTESVVDYAKKHKISVEDAGRMVRYQFFNEISKNYKHSKIATAHHLNDSVETMLLNLFRGAGMSGLKGIEVKNHNIIRPLLCLTRDEIDQYCKDHQLEYMEDSTNFTIDYDRNRLRHEVLPYIEKYYNQNLFQTLGRTMQIIQKEDEMLDRYAIDALTECLNENTLNIERFNKRPVALRRRMIRYWVQKLRGTTKDLSYQDVEELLALTDKKHAKKVIFKDLIFEKSYDDIIVLDESILTKNQTMMPFSLGTQYFNDYKITAVLMDRHDFTKTSFKGKFFFDARIMNENLVIRSRLDGDRIVQFNNLSKKLKEIFIDYKIPRIQRDTLPLLVGNEIYFVGDLKRSNKYLVCEDSEKILQVEVTKIE